MKLYNPKQFGAAEEFNRAIISKVITKRGVHAETAISAASRMAGTFVLRSSGLPLAQFAPGTPIFSDDVNERGQQVLGTVDRALSSMSIPFDARKLNYDLAEEHNPLMDLKQIQALLDPAFRAILQKYELNDEEAAYAAALSTASLIQKCSSFLDPHVSYVIAAYGMVEASKTVPFDAVQVQ